MGLHESKGLECHRTSPEGQEQGHDDDDEEEEEEQDTAVAPLLHVAARKGRLEAARRLLSQGAEAVNGQDAGGRTALFWATEFRHEGLAQLLLSRGADPAARDHEGNSCLHWAAYVGHVPIARLLLEAGAELNVPNAQGDTPLHVAAQEGSDECLALLLAHGAKVSLKNQAGQLPLHYAALGSPSWRALHTFSALPPQQVERILCRDISRGFENIPIPCLNGVDNEPCPHDFLYITQNLISESVAFLATGWGRSQRCQCQGPCSAASCPCILRSKHTWYTADGQLALDSTSSTAEMAPIYECSQLCSCGSSCPNRLVQQGIRTQLQLYRIAAKGWGVRTMQDVSQGTFICQYFGELISCTEAARRAEDTYYFVVDIKVAPAPQQGKGAGDRVQGTLSSWAGVLNMCPEGCMGRPQPCHGAGRGVQGLAHLLQGIAEPRRCPPPRTGWARMLPGWAPLRQCGPLPEPLVPAQPGGPASGRWPRGPRHRVLQHPGHPGRRRAWVRLRRRLLGEEGARLRLPVPGAHLPIPAAAAGTSWPRALARRGRLERPPAPPPRAARLRAQVQAREPAEGGAAPRAPRRARASAARLLEAIKRLSPRAARPWPDCRAGGGSRGAPGAWPSPRDSPAPRS